MKAVLERFRDHFPDDPLVERLTAKDLLDFKRARVARSRLRPRSINTDLMKVGAMLSRAGDYFPSLASWKPPAVPYESVPEAARERVITRDEAARMLEALCAPLLDRGADPGRRRREPESGRRTRLPVADLWELAPLVGMRTTELRLMEWP